MVAWYVLNTALPLLSLCYVELTPLCSAVAASFLCYFFLIPADHSEVDTKEGPSLLCNGFGYVVFIQTTLNGMLLHSTTPGLAPIISQDRNRQGTE